MADKYKALRLKNQLCFPIYAVSNMITRKYKPMLDRYDLTYTQYIVMMVLWEEKEINEKKLCEALFLRSNTLTPLLRKLIRKGYVQKERDARDERRIVISLTEKGEALKDNILCVPEEMAKAFSLSADEAVFLYQILYKMLDQEKAGEEKD